MLAVKTEKQGYPKKKVDVKIPSDHNKHQILVQNRVLPNHNAARTIAIPGLLLEAMLEVNNWDEVDILLDLITSRKVSCLSPFPKYLLFTVHVHVL